MLNERLLKLLRIFIITAILPVPSCHDLLTFNDSIKFYNPYDLKGDAFFPDELTASFSPYNNQESVNPDTNIIITFSRPVKKTGWSVVISPELVYETSFDETSTRFIITPLSFLKSGTRYTVNLDGFISSDLNQLMLKKSYSDFSFTIAEGPIITFNPLENLYNYDIFVEILCSIDDAIVYYTTDSTDPLTSLTAQEYPPTPYGISVEGNSTTAVTITIKAIAVKNEILESDIAEATYTIDYDKVSTPQFSIPGDTYPEDKIVEISCPTEDATIYYTTDGTDPLTSSTSKEYSTTPDGIPVEGNGTMMTIRAIAVKDGMKDSEITEDIYTIEYPSPNVYDVSPAGGTTIYINSPIIVRFDQPMNPDSLVISGDMASEANTGSWSTNTYTDDTLTISPSSSWTVGNGRTLIIDCNSNLGVELSQLVLEYDIDIYRVITISSPNGEELWRVGTPQSIIWDSEGIENVRIELYRNGAWEYIDGGSPVVNLGNYSWTVASPTASDALVRVTDADGSSVTDSSDAVFTIGSKVWYVDSAASSGGDGATWASAFQTIQVGVSAATSGEEVWVKAGTYYRNGTDETLLALKTDVDVYGGFSGSENLITDRHLETNISTLNGQSVVHRVITGANNVILDGFKITGGVNTNRDGCGLTSGATNFTISNCIFTDNQSNNGGAVFLSGGSINFANCNFDHNEAARGGVIYSVLGSSINISDCTFYYNYANGWGNDGEGGALNLNDCTFAIQNCDFYMNFADDDGDQLAYGGAIYIDDSAGVLSSSRFYRNESDYYGGAVYLEVGLYDEKVDVVNCEFVSNYSDLHGGAIVTTKGDYEHYPINIINCSFSSNEATDGHGGGIYNFSDSELTIINSVIYYNYALGSLNQIYNADTSVCNVTYSNIQGGGFSGSGNINENPAFIDSNSDLHLRSWSYCINAANASVAPATDKDGEERNDGYPDIGAFEYKE
ncbi:MAG: chitobiase/beta-hexosaminidase C-terminal domain-containing protein [Spirochaetes bacterium]|nr:chitobiase/beta-hexosaminidase C-terminal domain-containing protein [Spirochaetota bacterium]